MNTCKNCIWYYQKRCKRFENIFYDSIKEHFSNEDDKPPFVTVEVDPDQSCPHFWAICIVINA